MRTLVVTRSLAHGLPSAALFCELAKFSHDAGSWVPYDITGPLADARGSGCDGEKFG